MSDPWPFRSSLELGALSTPQPPGPRPRPRPGEPGAEGTSDGVLLIAALSTRWDWYPTEDPPGKVVWCELELSVDPLAPAEDTLELPLPRRVPRARPKPQAEIVTDLDILRRLRDHLLS